jgi:hypothetical protein
MPGKIKISHIQQYAVAPDTFTSEASVISQRRKKPRGGWPKRLAFLTQHKMLKHNFDESRAYLWVRDYGEDASVVTNLIGMEPTYVQVTGQPMPQFPKMLARVHCWKLHSPLPSDAHLDDHIEALLGLLEPHAAAVRAASERFEAGVNVYVYYHRDFNPGINLSQRAVQLLASMNLSIDFDLYFLMGHDKKQGTAAESV